MPKILNPAFAQHLRITCRGIFGANVGSTPFEEFSFRLNMSDPQGNPTPRFTQIGFDDIVADCSSFFARPGSKISDECKLTEVKFARIGPAGVYLAEPFIAAVSVKGTGGIALRFPPQVSLAVSLQSAARGPRGKGRFYLPGPGMPFSSANGQISAADADAVRDSVTLLVNDLNNWPGIDSFDPRVTIASTSGVNNDVTGVRVGRVLDTIRSRRGDIPEAYSALSVVA